VPASSSSLPLLLDVRPRHEFRIASLPGEPQSSQTTVRWRAASLRKVDVATIYKTVTVKPSKRYTESSDWDNYDAQIGSRQLLTATDCASSTLIVTMKFNLVEGKNQTSISKTTCE
jgi:hypothetical protein